MNVPEMSPLCAWGIERSPMAGPVPPITLPMYRCASVAGEDSPENLPCTENLPLSSSVASTVPRPWTLAPCRPFFGVGPISVWYFSTANAGAQKAAQETAKRSARAPILQIPILTPCRKQPWAPALLSEAHLPPGSIYHCVE